MASAPRQNIRSLIDSRVLWGFVSLLLCPAVLTTGYWFGNGGKVLSETPQREPHTDRINSVNAGGEIRSATPLVVPVVRETGFIDSTVCRQGAMLVIGVPVSESSINLIRIDPIRHEQNVPVSEKLETLSPIFQPDRHPGLACTHVHLKRVEKPRPESNERSFQFPVFHTGPSDGTPGRIDSVLLAIGRQTVVYVDRRDRHLPNLNPLGNEIVRLMDEELLSTIETKIWPIADLDGNGRVSVLLSSQMTRVSPSQSFAAVPLKGMTWSEDYSPEGALGNRADVFYLHAQLRNDKGLKSLLLHELAHAACFSRCCHASVTDRKIPPDWISEGIAHLAETWNNDDRSNWGARIAAFEAATHESPLFVPAYARQGLWRHPGSRGAVISFFYWLGRRSPENFVNQWSAAATLDDMGLESMYAMNLPGLFRFWSVDQTRDWMRRKSPAIVRLPNHATEISLKGSTFAVYDLPAGAPGYRIQFPSGVPGQITILPLN